MKEISDIIGAWRRWRGQPLALATLVRAVGSSYRRPGARMLLCPDGTTVGSLSGGCLEEEVAVCGREVVRSGTSVLMKFDTRARFGCNGVIEVFVEPFGETFAEELARRFEQRCTFRAATNYVAGFADLGSRILLENDEPAPHVFVQTIHPPIRLLIYGEGPDSGPLRKFAEILGWDVVELHSATAPPQAIDDRTAAVVKTHNYGRDFAALRSLLPLDLAYVGLMGPRKRRDQLLHALLDQGIPLDAELFAPAGLDLNAETPEEIALAIVSEIQSVFAAGTAASLRNRKAPIHGWIPVATTPAGASRTAAERACEVSLP